MLFGRARTDRRAVTRVVIGQYVGFAAILVLSLAGAVGARLLPAAIVPYLGLLPIAVGLHAAWGSSPAGRRRESDSSEAPGSRRGSAAAGPSVAAVATVTLGNGGDNIGVYIPVFALSSPPEVLVCCLVFLVLVAVWCAAGHFVARRALVAAILSRWDHVLVPVVLVTIGLIILTRGHAFGL